MASLGLSAYPPLVALTSDLACLTWWLAGGQRIVEGRQLARVALGHPSGGGRAWLPPAGEDGRRQEPVGVGGGGETPAGWLRADGANHC